MYLRNFAFRWTNTSKLLVWETNLRMKRTDALSFLPQKKMNSSHRLISQRGEKQLSFFKDGDEGI